MKEQSHQDAAGGQWLPFLGCFAIAALVMSQSRLGLLPRVSFFPLATDPGDLWLYAWTSVFLLESTMFIVLRVAGHV